MGIQGFDFLAAEKDMSKKVEELASVLENVATIFLNGVGSLEKQLEGIRSRLSKVETQVDTMLRVGGGKVAPSPAGKVEDVVATSPGVTPPPPVGSSPPTSVTGGPPHAPTSPLGATSGIGIKAQMQGELRGFLARRRVALEARMAEEEK